MMKKEKIYFMSQKANAGVAELADALDLGSSGAPLLKGSNPFARTILYFVFILPCFLIIACILSCETSLVTVFGRYF